MRLGISSSKWQFLRPERAKAYIAAYKALRKKGSQEGWRRLSAATTKRQFATAYEILNRMKRGQKGVLLADDVGLGKTTVAVLCALVFAGSGERVRILAPNGMMARRWRQELELHFHAVAAFARHLDLEKGLRRLSDRVWRLHGGAIEVSTHRKASRLACDLLIIDEAHRTRSEHSNLAKSYGEQRKSVGRVLILTATPFSLDPNDLARMLVRIGGHDAEMPVRRYANLQQELWSGRVYAENSRAADELVAAARKAVKAMRPFVVRHGIEDLSTQEKVAFGGVDAPLEQDSPVVPDSLLEAMLRTDRALQLGQRVDAWHAVRKNDPRYHVAAGRLQSDLTQLLQSSRATPVSELALLRHHATVAHRLLRQHPRHPKIAHTVGAVREIVAKGEKVIVFCDHHQPAAELTDALAQALRWPRLKSRDERQLWSQAWSQILHGSRDDADQATRPATAHARLDHYVEWLASPGVTAQVGQWLGLKVRAGFKQETLVQLLKSCNARNHPACDSIAAHARELYRQLTDPESRSTLAILGKADKYRLPGATLARVATTAEDDDESSRMSSAHPGVFYWYEPDAVLAVFNSPFGPDVLVTTDRLSEGIDLHRFCRHVIHHELDPSPVRTIQRNGRVRRVDCWAARSNQPVRVYYPRLKGTRDEKLVEIMQNRLQQFGLLLGGIRQEIDPDEADSAGRKVSEILRMARARLGRLRLGIKLRRRT